MVKKNIFRKLEEFRNLAFYVQLLYLYAINIVVNCISLYALKF